jgi:hypothetical protein
MTVTFEPLPGKGLHLLDRPQLGLTLSTEMNRLHRHGVIMHKPPPVASLTAAEALEVTLPSRCLTP